MTQPDPLVRQQHLSQLAPFLRALTGWAEKFPAGTSRFPLQDALSAECVQCGVQLTGEELIALAQDPQIAGTPKVERLRQGYCARRGCDSYYYRLRFAQAPGVDWSQALAEADTFRTQPEDSAATTDQNPVMAFWAADRRRMIFILAAVGLVGALLLARQLYIGGTIPLIREPEHFQVDATPDQE